MSPLQYPSDWEGANEVCNKLGMQLFFAENWFGSGSAKMKAQTTLEQFWIGLRNSQPDGWMLVNHTVVHESAIPFAQDVDLNVELVFEAMSHSKFFFHNQLKFSVHI